MRIVQSLAIAAVLGVAAFAAPSASAADFGVSVNLGNGSYYGDYDSVWVPPVYRTEYYYGQPRYIIVVPGYYRRVYRPHYHHYHNHGSYYGNNSYYNRGSSYYNRGNDHRGHDHSRRDNNRDHRGHDHNRNDRNDRRR